MGKITVIIGPARAGKTTFANWLVSKRGGDAKTAGTSEIIYEAMQKATGKSLAELKSVPKEELRPRLIEFADYLCDIYPDILSRALVQRGVNIIDGIRRREELQWLKDKYDTEIFYIERYEGVVKDNFELNPSDADYIVDNTGPLSPDGFEINSNPIKFQWQTNQ